MMMASGMSDNRNNQSESIHSGQFMVSHFEKDDEEGADDDDVVEMLSPQQPDVNADPVVGSTAVCHNQQYIRPYGMELQRYNPAVVAHHKTVSSVEIDSDLSTVFNTLNVTYQQKLTSPKWNPFKGIRLRWKEKIRLNNVIWRCWHMQFILKRKTLVCQFASPLDTDVHNTPQAILLEGKYWKRHGNVIENEYLRWRRYHLNKALPANNETMSEIDFLEWSPNSYDIMPKFNDDILFSSISQFPVQFPFPDSREIAKAGRADFIQPSLGPLQPNFDDFMDIDLDFLNNCDFKRLAPVPEEETSEILKAIDNTPSFSMLTSSSGKMEISDNSTGITPMNIDTMQQQQQPSTSQFVDQSLSRTHLGGASNISSNAFITTTTSTNNNNSAQNVMSMTQQQQQQQQQTDDTTSSYLLRQKIPRGSYKTHSRREPIDYGKTQPTKHQTNVYNQLILQQQQQQNQNTVINYPGGGDVVNNQTFLAQTSPIHASPIQTTTNNFNIITAQQMPVVNDLNVVNLSNQEMGGVISKIIQSPIRMIPQNNQNIAQAQTQLQGMLSGNQIIQQNVGYKPQQSVFVLQQQQPQAANFQNTMNRQMLRQPSPPQMSTILDPQNFLSSAQQQATTREIGRSSSLPVNSTFQSAFAAHKDESFAMPKQSRGLAQQRKGSMSMHRTANNPLSGMQSANSEPMLNQSSALLQLLSNKTTNLLTKHSKSSNTVNAHQQQQQQLQQKPATSQIPKQSLPVQTMQSHLPPALQQKSLTFPTPALQNQLQHQTASTGMSTSILSTLKKNIQQQQAFGSPGFSTSTTSISMSTPSLSPDSALDIEMPMSPSSRQTSINSLKFSSPSTSNSREGSGRRAGHIHAEQKRRYNIKNGFDMLHSLIPELQNNPNAKLSKAAMLQKGAEYIRQLKAERGNLQDRMSVLRQEIDKLNNSLSHLQTALPADGAPVLKQRNSRMSELYEAYIRYRTNDSWKYWVFGLIFEPMMQSFNATVSVASMDDLIRTTNNWVDQHCSLIELRPAVSNKLRSLSTTTDLLAERPTSLKQEVEKAMTKSNSCSSSSSGYQT